MSGGILFFASVAAYVAAASMGLYRMRSRLFRPGPAQFAAFAGALALHTWHLMIRGQEVGRCPVTSYADVMVFVAWSLALAYVAVGPVYRFTIPGVLTAPLVALLLLVSLAIPREAFRPAGEKISAAVEFHAASSLLAYGALGLACVTGLFYLIHDHCIRRKRLRAWFDNLPSLHQLSRVNRGLILYGLGLMAIGIVSGFFTPGGASKIKTAYFVLMWVVYAALFVAGATSRLSGRRTALFSALLFAAMILSFWTLGMARGGMGDGP